MDGESGPEGTQQTAAATPKGVSIDLGLKPPWSRLPASWGMAALRCSIRPPGVQVLGDGYGRTECLSLEQNVPSLLRRLCRALLKPGGTSYPISWVTGQFPPQPKVTSDSKATLGAPDELVIKSTADMPLPRAHSEGRPLPAHQVLPAGGQLPPLLRCGSWGLPSPQRALGTGGKGETISQQTPLLVGRPLLCRPFS